MENYLTPIEMLDKVLAWFSMDVPENSNTVFIPREAVYKSEAFKNIPEVFPELNNTNFLLYSDLILRKLVKDGFIDAINSHEDLYGVTFDGKLFSQQGGYKQKLINQNQERERIRVLETYPKKLNRLTLWVAIATGIAAVYYLIEVLKDFCLFHR